MIIMLKILILLLLIIYNMSYQFINHKIKYNKKKIIILFDSNNNNNNDNVDDNKVMNTIKYPSITSRRDLFSSNDNYIPSNDITTNTIYDDMNVIPKGLEMIEPSELIINNDKNNDNNDNDDMIKVDKFRFKVNSNDLKKAIEMRSSLKTKQINNNNDDTINDINLQLSPEMVDLLSKVDIEEINGKRKISLRINSNELDNLISNNNNNNNDNINNDDDDFNIDDDFNNIDQDIYNYNNNKNNKMKTIKPATFYGDERRLSSLSSINDNKNLNSIKSSSSWWIAGLEKYELSSDLIGTTFLMTGLTLTINFFDYFSKLLLRLSSSLISKILIFLKIDKFFHKRFIPLCIICYLVGQGLKKYIIIKNDHKYDGIGYRVQEK